MKIAVNGPGVTTGGATEWSLSATAGGTSCTYLSSANWYVGPTATNPLAVRINKAGITSTAWSYGVGSAACTINGWSTNTLLGFSQIAKSITIVSFTKAGLGYGTPVDQITYALVPAP